MQPILLTVVGTARNEDDPGAWNMYPKGARLLIACPFHARPLDEVDPVDRAKAIVAIPGDGWEYLVEESIDDIANLVDTRRAG